MNLEIIDQPLAAILTITFSAGITVNNDRAGNGPNLLIVFYVQIMPDDFVMQWICPYISRHLLSLNPLLARCRRYSRGER